MFDQTLAQLVDQAVSLRTQIQTLQERYDGLRTQLQGELAAAGQRNYYHSGYRVSLTEPRVIETVSKDLLAKALREADIPREKKVFIWKRAVTQTQRAATVVIAVDRQGGTDEGTVREAGGVVMRLWVLRRTTGHECGSCDWSRLEAGG